MTATAVTAAQPARFGAPVNRPLWIWLLVGLLGYLVVPWYAQQDSNGLLVVARVWSDEQAANGLLQAAQWGRPWLWLGLVGLAVAGVGAAMPAGRKQGAWLAGGGALGVLALMLSGFTIGARGWAFEWMTQSWGELGARQPGVGWGGFVVLASLLVLLAFGAARRGFFKGDLFVAAAVLGCGSLLGLFIVFPVTKALSAAFFLEDGAFALGAVWDRIAQERNFGLGCLAGGQVCGVAWNTLFLGLLTATSTVVLGTFMALMAERTSRRYVRPLNVVALLPIITPPFVVGLGLILLFGRAGVFNQFLEYAFGITPTRWFYGWLGIWVAQTFAFTPIAFMIMRGVVQGVAPSLEEAAQTLRANPLQTFLTITLPLLKPGLANAFLVGFIESMADFGNPIVVGGQFSVLSTEIFFAIVGAQYDQGRAASLAWILT
ncbi:MAG: ABC transporter permease subunit, partial [Burkholderiaceae bacterium]|nr:ABC transporter permease subunit [Burkholderiaceae bacterium]